MLKLGIKWFKKYVLKPHIEITLSVNGYALFVSVFLNLFLNEIREQEKTTSKCQIFWNLRKGFRLKKSQFSYLLEKISWY